MPVFIFISDTMLVLISLAGIWCSSDSVSFASKSLCYFNVDTLSLTKGLESSNHVQINGDDSLYTNQQRSQDTDDEFHEQRVGRKIVVSFPIMASLSSTKKKDMVDVNFKCSNTNTSQLQQQLGGYAC
ncbi:hypothetical protein OROMI_003453 [Orobanche minor]